MHVLWIVPDYYSFLCEELLALAERVERLSVISQYPMSFSGKVDSVTISRDRFNLTRLRKRAEFFYDAVLKGSYPRSYCDLPKFRRIARHNEAISDYVEREKVDIVHSHFAVPEGTAGWQGALGRPVVLTLRGVDILTVPSIGYGFLLDEYYKRNLSNSFKKVDVITVASKQTFDAALSCGASRDKIRLIPNGVDTKRFSSDSNKGEDIRIRLGIGERPLVIGVGNLIPRKAFDNLIEALRVVRVTHPDVCLAILGNGPEKDALASLGRVRLSPTSFFLPGRISRDEINAYFSAATVFVHSSRSEGFGNVILEAMATGCPVVATKTGAAADIIRDGINGRLVNVDDVGSLGAAVSSILSEEAGRQRMATEARKLVGKCYSLESRAASFVRIYEEALENGE